jgi:hypothetical protein
MPEQAAGGPWALFPFRIRCKPYTAWLTPEGCQRNRTTACEALRTLQEGLEPWEVALPGLDRLLTCGRCPRGEAEIQPVTTEWILTLIEECLARLDIYVGQTADPELYQARQQESKRRWARKNRSRVSKGD